MGSFMAISHDPARPKRLPLTDIGKRRPDIIPRTTSNSNFLLNIISFFLPRTSRTAIEESQMRGGSDTFLVLCPSFQPEIEQGRLGAPCQKGRAHYALPLLSVYYKSLFQSFCLPITLRITSFKNNGCVKNPRIIPITVIPMIESGRDLLRDCFMPAMAFCCA